jgi:Flp pilus assembly protein protease CpaA
MMGMLEGKKFCPFSLWITCSASITYILYSGKFSYFRMLYPLCKNKNDKNLNMPNFFLACVTFDRSIPHAVAAAAKCANIVSVLVLCQGIETE